VLKAVFKALAPRPRDITAHRGADATASKGRRFLPQLPADMADKIAYKNFERLFP
jgi:hypothetical protein